MGLLTFIVIVLGVLVVGKLMRVFEFTRDLTNPPIEVTQRENKFNATMMLLFMIGYFIYVAYMILHWGDQLLPESASVHGEKWDTLLKVNWYIIAVPFVLVHFFLFFFAYKYVYNKNRKAKFFAHDNKLEMIWTVVPSCVLAVIIVWGLRNWNEMTDEEPADAITIELFSRQFDWTARYAGADSLLGKSSFRLISAENMMGVDLTDPNAADDKIIKGEFHIPVGKPVNFVFRSQDVIHSAYMPHFRLQMNTVPGQPTEFHMIPKTTTEEMRQKLGDEEFNYVLLCNKICGASHYNMQMAIIVESEDDYEAWLNEQKTLAATMNMESVEAKDIELAQK